jgi:pimeloyl-ACP methyl ester carboxylesterase
MRQFIFDVTIYCTGRALLARDILLGRVKRNWDIRPSDHGFSRHRILSGKNVLDAVLFDPGKERTRAAVLLCHGIGETVQHWFEVQQLLGAQGVASLVFDYCGYGRSTGLFHAHESERDAEAAFQFLLERIGPLPISILGFSLGSGIAVAVLPRVAASSLLLCAAFPSMRDAACSVGVPRFLRFGVPSIWSAADNLRASQVRVLIVHGEKDRLFPVTMAAELDSLCGGQSEIVLVPRLTHNEPFYRPSMSYWGPIVAHVLAAPDCRPIITDACQPATDP